MVRNRSETRNYSGDQSKCIYCCLPCIGCFFAGEKLLQSMCIGILWVFSCGGGFLCKKRNREVIPRNDEIISSCEEETKDSMFDDVTIS